MTGIGGPTISSDFSFRNGLFRVRRVIDQSNLLVISDKTEAIDAAIDSIICHRSQLESYLSQHEAYKLSLFPVEIEKDAPTIVKLAALAAKNAKVGPMAAIPGALAELAVEEMLETGASICVVENGGEIAIVSDRSIRVGVYTGLSPFSDCFGLQLFPKDLPVGIATSSATVGHALTLGQADSAIVIAESASLADAVATAVCNAVQGDDVEASIQLGLAVAESIPYVKSSIIVRGGYVGTTGKLPKLLRLEGSPDEMLVAVCLNNGRKR